MQINIDTHAFTNN